MGDSDEVFRNAALSPMRRRHSISHPAQLIVKCWRKMRRTRLDIIPAGFFSDSTNTQIKFRAHIGYGSSIFNAYFGLLPRGSEGRKCWRIERSSGRWGCVACRFDRGPSC